MVQRRSAYEKIIRNKILLNNMKTTYCCIANIVSCVVVLHIIKIRKFFESFIYKTIDWMDPKRMWLKFMSSTFQMKNTQQIHDFRCNKSRLRILIVKCTTTTPLTLFGARKRQKKLILKLKYISYFACTFNVFVSTFFGRCS